MAPDVAPSAETRHWAQGGMAHLTRTTTGRPDFSRSAVLTAADSVARPFGVDANTLLTRRAALLELSGGGRRSAGGATRLLRARDGWVAITLSRQSDLESVPALVRSTAATARPWEALEVFARGNSTEIVVERAQLLGIPAAALGSTGPAEPRVHTVLPAPGPLPLDSNTVVVDLSSMWAGPLCGMLLGRLGATVVKVESTTRPDGARAGHPTFFSWLNGSKYHCRIPFRRDDATLGSLVDAADIVIEASRPRALRHLGVDAEHRPARSGRVWVRITGHGPDFPERVAFGDDAAVAGGLVGAGTVFCGDAIADPLTGLAAAEAVVASLRRGGGEIIDVSMAAVAAGYAALPLRPDPPDDPVARAPQPSVNDPRSATGTGERWVRTILGGLPC